MKSTKNLFKTIICSIFSGLLTISISYADAPRSVQALEHAVAAKTHGKLRHAKEFKLHAEAAIKHATASDKVHSDAHTHITMVSEHTQQAIVHIKNTF